MYIRNIAFLLIGTCALSAAFAQGRRSSPSKVKPAIEKNDTLNIDKTGIVDYQPSNHVKRDVVQHPPQRILPFVPKGFLITDTCQGDLNLDTYPDLLVVVVRADEGELTKVADTMVKRRLLILTGNANGSYKLAAQTANVVYGLEHNGMIRDPFLKLTISKGTFSVENTGGSRMKWNRVTTFSWSPADHTWLLSRDGYSQYDAFGDEPVGKEKRTYHFYTKADFGRIPFKNYDCYQHYGWLK